MGVKEGLLTLFLGTPGQLGTRIYDLNGSLDKPWLLAFFFFPFSIVSSIWFFNDWVEKGEGEDPVDEFVYILPISCVIFSFIFRNLCGISGIISAPLILMFTIVTFIAARILRKKKVCKNVQDLTYGRAVQYGIISSGAAVLSSAIIALLGFIPLIGIPFKLLAMIDDFIPGFNIGLLSSVIHLILNMEANTFKSKENEFCTDKKDIFHWETLVWFFAAIIVSIMSSFITDPFPF